MSAILYAFDICDSDAADITWIFLAAKGGYHTIEWSKPNSNFATIHPTNHHLWRPLPRGEIAAI